jgi:hypothetical protein
MDHNPRYFKGISFSQLNNKKRKNETFDHVRALIMNSYSIKKWTAQNAEFQIKPSKQPRFMRILTKKLITLCVYTTETSSLHYSFISL